jgi:hypothetical protein
MHHWRLLVLFALLSACANAQWLSFPTPGTPRLPDGKPNLAAPVPRAADGKPDLSGVWMHEITTVAEMKRLYREAIEEAIKVDVPGMEIGTQHKYAINILLDFKPQDSPMRPEAAQAMRGRGDTDPARVCADIAGIPLNDLLSEPMKIVQSPRLTVFMYEVDNAHRQIYTDGRAATQGVRLSGLPGLLGWSLGGRYARGGDRRFQ